MEREDIEREIEGMKEPAENERDLLGREESLKRGGEK